MGGPGGGAREEAPPPQAADGPADEARAAAAAGGDGRVLPQQLEDPPQGEGGGLEEEEKEEEEEERSEQEQGDVDTRYADPLPRSPRGVQNTRDYLTPVCTSFPVVSTCTSFVHTSNNCQISAQYKHIGPIKTLLKKGVTSPYNQPVLPGGGYNQPVETPKDERERTAWKSPGSELQGFTTDPQSWLLAYPRQRRLCVRQVNPPPPFHPQPPARVSSPANKSSVAVRPTLVHST